MRGSADRAEVLRRVVGKSCLWCRKCVMAGSARMVELQYRPLEERACYAAADWDGYRAACAALLRELEAAEA